MNAQPDSPHKEAISVKSDQNVINTTGCLLVAFGLFLVAPLWMAGQVVVVPLMHVAEARQWQAVPCRIVASRVEVKHEGDNGPSYIVDIEYEYEFGDQKRISKQYDFLNWTDRGSASACEIVRQFPANRKTTCFVNPRNPTQAVINRDNPIGIFEVAFLGVFILVGGVGLLGTLYYRAAKRKTASLANDKQLLSTDEKIDAVAPHANLVARVEPGPVTLKPEASRLFGFLFVSAFAIIWNGVLWCLFISWKDWFSILFQVPFIIAGLIAIGLAIYCGLALLNPLPTLVINTNALQIGFPLEASWEFAGRTNSLRRLEIFLEGKEVARRGSGDGQETETSIFAKIPLVDTQNPAEFPGGQASVVVPMNTMHSWNGGNNRIEWNLRVMGEIHFWPKVNETFPITIYAVRLGD